jgi:hypothetical protein
MATMRLYPVSAATLVLRALPVAALASTVLYLTPVESPSTTLVLLPVGTLPPSSGSPSFPTQYAGLRTYYGGAVRELCLVAAADANTGMGAAPMIRKGGTTYAVYLVETTDPNATPVRVRTSTGTKAIRVKT